MPGDTGINLDLDGDLSSPGDTGTGSSSTELILRRSGLPKNLVCCLLLLEAHVVCLASKSVICSGV